MRAVTEPGVRTITVMTCTQLLKSSVLENVFGFFAHLDPAPMLLVQPKDAAAEAFSKERIAPMIAATPVLAEIVGTKKTRTSEDTLTYKSFPGGFLALVSAGSPTNLAMRPIRVALYDEVDKYEVTKEGDVIALGDERMATFPTNSLSIRACSPTEEGLSRIERSYLDSDQRKPLLACPHCGHRQYLDFFAHVKWAKDEDGTHHPHTASVWCESCGSAWSEPERLLAIRGVRWFQTRRFTCCGEGQEPLERLKEEVAAGSADPCASVWRWDSDHIVGYAICRHCGVDAVSNRHAGFQAGKLLSPWAPVSDVAKKWLDSSGQDDLRRSWFNTQLGLPYRPAATKEVKTHVLAARRELWDENVLPDGVAVITAGVDVQGDRLAIEVVGWGRDEESWSLAYEELPGDPALPDVWNRLDRDYLLHKWHRADGRSLTIEAACLDTGGHHTQEAYRFSLARLGRRVWAIKGASDRAGESSPVWPRVQLKRSKSKGFRPTIIGVNAAKDQVRARWAVTQPGPSYCHVPHDRDLVWFEQMLAEFARYETVNGTKARRWVLPPGRANEALDCRVYAYAALVGMTQTAGLRLNRRADAFGIARHDPPEQEAVTVTSAPEPIESPAPMPVSQRKQQSIPRRGMVSRASFLRR